MTRYVDEKKLDYLMASGPKLTDAWKVNIHHRLNLIRKIINESGVNESRKSDLLSKVNALATAVDQDRDVLQRSIGAMVAICEGIADGCTALRRGVRLLEDVTGALSKSLTHKS